MSSNAPQFFAKLFWIGPLTGPGDPDRNRLIHIAGAVDPAQGTACAASFVPVVIDKQHDRYLPAGTSGASSVERVAKLSNIRSGRDGWFRLQGEASWWEGVDGVLTLLLYDIDLGDGTFPYGLRALTSLGRSLLSSLSRPAQSARPFPPGAEKAMYKTITRLLNDTNVAKLKRGLVTI